MPTFRGTLCLFHLHRWCKKKKISRDEISRVFLNQTLTCINTPTFSSRLFVLLTPPMKMEKCSETSAQTIQTPGNHQKDGIQNVTWNFPEKKTFGYSSLMANTILFFLICSRRTKKCLYILDKKCLKVYTHSQKRPSLWVRQSYFRICVLYRRPHASCYQQISTAIHGLVSQVLRKSANGTTVLHMLTFHSVVTKWTSPDTSHLSDVFISYLQT